IEKNVDLIITGGAKGVDRIAEAYADKHRISKLIVYPQYKLYHRAAPLKRNDIMVDIADKILVFWDGNSKGSRYVIEYARMRGKDIKIIYCGEIRK
ncbi:MAG: hypothetical protein IJ303_05240, partial [Clostridia bacterium]|nr:hypothetical protein [Clostridia bacterium]